MMRFRSPKVPNWVPALAAAVLLVCAARGVAAEGVAVPEITGPRDLFALQGIDQSHFDMLVDGTPWREGENETLLKVMYRLDRDFRPIQMESWCRGDAEPQALADDPDAARGRIFRLAGRVVSIEVRRPVPEVARRFELREYYRCRFRLGDTEQPAVLFAHTIPEAWKAREGIDFRAGALAVFLKLAGDDPGRPVPVFVASRVAWYPPTPLGDLGFDWGLFDDLRPDTTVAGEDAEAAGWKRGDPRYFQLTSRNRECFYQMLAAAARTAAGELRALATERLKRLGKEEYSVAPLFNEPEEQHGRLVKLSGTARQVMRVRVGDADVVARFGIHEYYQVFLFTEDSWSRRGEPGRNPIVFCAAELPEGMPIGAGPDFAERVTAAGFFFNRWAYRNRASGDAATAGGQWQLAPLLVARDLAWHPPEEPASNPYVAAIAVGAFVLVLLGIWLALWRCGRGDRGFRKRVIARMYDREAGASLDAVARRAEDAPE